MFFIPIFVAKTVWDSKILKPEILKDNLQKKDNLRIRDNSKQKDDFVKLQS